jgi:hypothetical protein
MVLKKALLSAAAILLVATISYALGLQASEKKEEAYTGRKSNTVGIYIESVQRQIDIRELQKRYPAESAQRINPGALRADAIVGWYDKGNSFHEQKMQNNLKSLGGIQILPEMLKGAALRGEIHQATH